MSLQDIVGNVNEFLSKRVEDVISRLQENGVNYFGDMPIHGPFVLYDDDGNCIAGDLNNDGTGYCATASPTTAQLFFYLKIVNGVFTEGMDCLELPFDTLDLDSTGTRWEGQILNGKPFGYGTLFNSSDRLNYAGYIINGQKHIFGIDYYEDVELRDYEGHYVCNQRYGLGTFYDRNEEVIFYGPVIGKPILDLEVKIPAYSMDITGLNTSTSSIIVEDHCCKYQYACKQFSFDKWRALPALKKIIISKYCFNFVKQIEISDYYQLEVLSINSFSFTLLSPDGRGKALEPAEGSFFRIKNCPSLKALTIGCGSFAEYQSFELEGMLMNEPSIYVYNPISF